MTDHQGTFQHLNPCNGETVHLLALHLEMSAQYGHTGLDSAQAMQVAHALRSVAENADSIIEAYNHMVDIVDRYKKRDDYYAALGKRVRKAVCWVMYFGALIGLALWLR